MREEFEPFKVLSKDSEVIPEGKYKVIYYTFMQLIKNKVLSEEIKEEDKVAFTFMLDQGKFVFKNAKLKYIKLLSEESFLQFLLSILERVKKGNLASKENLKNGEVEKIIDECMSDICNTEAKDSFVKLIGWLFGINIDPNFFLVLSSVDCYFLIKAKKKMMDYYLVMKGW
ncbi:hypothetical protein GOY13_01815 [Wolbachia endosymbiont of Cruorifilaria tuberocauda]|uniref:hypothetical protein n=1 Tax=Wolbachia endosymbiont of Cruorifilaria tuberocauda TaxID=1812111 RepID=UPI00158CA9B7|nr:hypothetical protein [Wolbachia endosymbiont of Cruorifilaria tuberocauda]QKX01672.1 hypothetical protein GOY13_01815 [Wolbachia endosymbiont of Cruorifilaria tuberocauda]